MKTNSRWFHFVIPFLIQLGILGVCMVLHRTSIGMGGFIAEQAEIGGQLTKPTVGRLCFMIATAVLFFVFLIIASKGAKKDKAYLPFILGNFAGTFLWQAIGEDAWNFSINGTYFVQLESISVLPLVIVFIAALIYCWKNNSLDWGIWCAVLSFAINWMGHYVLECTYVPFEGLVDAGVFMKCIGCGLGSVLFVLGLIFGLKKEQTTKKRMLYSMLCFFAMALIAFGMMEG